MKTVSKRCSTAVFAADLRHWECELNDKSVMRRGDLQATEGVGIGEVSPSQPTRGSGERRKLPSGVRGNAFLAYLRLTEHFW